MTRRSQDILDAALKLSPEERAELAVELMASVDGEPDPDAEASWAVEIGRRARRTREGTAGASDWATVRDRIDRRLRK